MAHTVTGHARLTGNTGGDKDDLSAGQGITETLGGWRVASDSAVGVDVAQVSSNTCKNDDGLVSFLVQFDG